MWSSFKLEFVRKRIFKNEFFQKELLYTHTSSSRKILSRKPVRIRKKVAAHLGSLSKKKRKAIGVVSPHAGFIYSGDVVGAVYS
jgi:hypothetical protein